MKGDFTRLTFDPRKHYTGVLKQQGRVDLDADWNEYVEIRDYLSRTEAQDVIGLCGEHNISQIMLHAENLTEHFFDLKSRQAGMILQKFVTYRVQVAVVLSPDYIKQGKFREMVAEANQGKHFRMFHDRNEAEAWLMRNYSD